MQGEKQRSTGCPQNRTWGDLALRSACDQEENRDQTTRQEWTAQNCLGRLKEETDGNKTN